MWSPIKLSQALSLEFSKRKPEGFFIILFCSILQRKKKKKSNTPFKELELAQKTLAPQLISNTNDISSLRLPGQSGLQSFDGLTHTHHGGVKLGLKEIKKRKPSDNVIRIVLHTSCISFSLWIFGGTRMGLIDLSA